MNFTGHLELGDWKGQPLLTVRDFELVDFLEDHFLEMGVETALVQPAESGAPYQLLFSVGITKASVWLALENIEQQEIERIVAINSGAGSAGHSA